MTDIDQLSHKILMVEDDVLVRMLITALLEKNGYHVSVAGSGKDMFEALSAQTYDLILLDLGLPDEDGLVLARKLRARCDVPLMILTGRTAASDRLAALEIGADDYLNKTVDPEEFLLRIRNLLRRSAGSDTQAKPIGHNGQHIAFHGWSLDLDGYTLSAPDGKPVSMTSGEISLLGALARNPGRVMSRSALLDAISGYDDPPSERMIDAFISRIRKKIEADPKHPKIITTLSGVGYKFNAE